MWASINSNNLEIVKHLIKSGMYVNAKGYNDNTALIIASINGVTKMVECLIENGADVNIKNKEGKTALDLAKNEDIKKLLEKAMGK